MRHASNIIENVTIDRFSHEGRGVSKINGKTVFVHGALAGETVTIRMIKRHRRYDEAIVEEVLQASEQRVPINCQFFGQCGGCSLQHLASEQQILLKQSVLAEQLQHFGDLNPEQWFEPLQVNQWHYRRKARLGVRYVAKKNKVLVGFREKNGRFIADMNHCEVLDKRLARLIEPLQSLLTNLAARESIPQIEVAAGDEGVVLVLRHLNELVASDLEQLQSFASEYGCQWYLQPKGPASAHLLAADDNPDTIERLYYKLPDFDLKLAFHPLDFTQVNADMNRKMVSRAVELLALEPEDSVLDLFCGLGNFTLAIARAAKRVVGVEGDENMVRRGYENAELNGVSNVDFYSHDLSTDCSQQSWWQENYSKLLLDPARSGALNIVQHIKQLNVDKIVYVSCNPATLARDAGELAKQGYQLSAAGVMDMFPHTTHVESIAVFDRLT